MSACNRCGAEFRWEKRPGGWVPLNADGSRHKCKGPARPALTKAGPRIVGKNYQPLPCGVGCDVPPWDLCACSKSANADQFFASAAKS